MKKIKYFLWALIIISELLVINNLLTLYKVENKYSFIAGIIMFSGNAGFVFYLARKSTKRK
ncbi:hypothetical protein ACQ33O_00865 [Ferruginibacter sp. SUN002]|uniref:hypothetical protein n=1 Tax=Ferruginibacter sp. SUN002 TaxID=2937789 RepID=UPI003D3605D4